MMEAKVEPFCSRLTRLATGVLGLKNATQLALIWDASAAEPPPDEGAADVGAAELGAELAMPLPLAPLLAPADGLEPDDEPPLLPQAATVSTSTASAAGAAMENALTGRIR